MMRRRFLPAANVAIWVFACVLAYARWIEPNWIEVQRVSVDVPKVMEKGAPLRIVQLSDLHTSHFGLREKALVRKVNALDPDLVLVTGDIAQYWSGTVAAVKVLNGIEAAGGVFVTLGDADYSNRQGHCTYCHGSGGAGPRSFRVLRGNLREINIRGNRVVIGGVDDPSGPEAHKVPELSERRREANLKVLLLSSPVDYREAAKYAYDLVLTGDTHGEQVRGAGDLFHPMEEDIGFEEVLGWVRSEGTPLYINRGIGTNVLSFRLMARPEITFFEVGARIPPNGS